MGEQYEPYRFDGGIMIVADNNNPANGDGSLYSQGTVYTDKLTNYTPTSNSISVPTGLMVMSTIDTSSSSSGAIVTLGGLGISKSLSLGGEVGMQYQTTVNIPTSGRKVYLDSNTSELRSIDSSNIVTSYQPKFNFEPTQNRNIVNNTFTNIGGFFVKANTTVTGVNLIGYMLESNSASLLNSNFQFQFRLFDYTNVDVLVQSGNITGNLPVTTFLPFTATTITDCLWEIHVKVTDYTLVKSIVVTQVYLTVH